MTDQFLCVTALGSRRSQFARRPTIKTGSTRFEGSRRLLQAAARAAAGQALVDRRGAAYRSALKTTAFVGEARRSRTHGEISRYF